MLLKHKGVTKSIQAMSSLLRFVDEVPIIFRFPAWSVPIDITMCIYLRLVSSIIDIYQSIYAATELKIKSID